MMTFEEAVRNNQTSKYWEFEEPVIKNTEKNVLCYYPQAKRLVVKFAYRSRKTGEMAGLRGTGLNLEALKESPDVLDWIIAILTGLKG